MVNAMDRARRKMEETMTSTERWGPRLCKTKHISGFWHISKTKSMVYTSNFLNYILLKKNKKTKIKKKPKMDLEERSKWKPHFDILHLLQSKVRDCRFFGFACWCEVTEEFGKQQPLWMTLHLFKMQNDQIVLQNSKLSREPSDWQAVD